MAFLGTTGLIGAILAILFGVLVLVVPKMLRVIVGLYFILQGVLYLIGYFL